MQETGGFNFDNVRRNTFLEQSGFKAPKATKTGTTIVGLIYKDGIVLGADTRATEGSIVADKKCEKIHYIAPNIWCCGAGTAADTENVTALISSQLALHRLAMGRQSRVDTAMTMLKQMLFKYQGHISAALILGGVDHTGSTLYTIYPHGSVDSLPYVTMGSGSLAAMAVFEAEFKPNLELEEAKQLVCRAVEAGIYNDLGSGGNVDLVVITRHGTEEFKPFKADNSRLYRAGNYSFKAGTTPVLKTEIVSIDKLLVTATQVTPMEI
eukprot:TRINITY_DN12884_c1_g1_i1.p1 TRINITY_DN12884_c1_g1~~TRINITY_DN12884_c1_g1_i1.p1  ORF type:complete len:267 (+),score=85.24 TRINITY_DN12884_c1_g1_i1:27-827(+)